jgi:hypothetical protein
MFSLTYLIIILTSVLAGLTFWQDTDQIFYNDLVKKLHKPAPVCQEECNNPEYPLQDLEETHLLSGGIYDRSSDLA